MSLLPLQCSKKYIYFHQRQSTLLASAIYISVLAPTRVFCSKFMVFYDHKDCNWNILTSGYLEREKNTKRNPPPVFFLTEYRIKYPKKKSCEKRVLSTLITNSSAHNWLLFGPQCDRNENSNNYAGPKNFQVGEEDLSQNNREGSFTIINMEFFIFPRKYLSKAL